MQNVVGPTLVATATTFALGAESNRLPACIVYFTLDGRWLTFCRFDVESRLLSSADAAGFGCSGGGGGGCTRASLPLVLASPSTSSSSVLYHHRHHHSHHPQQQQQQQQQPQQPQQRRESFLYRSNSEYDVTPRSGSRHSSLTPSEHL